MNISTLNHVPAGTNTLPRFFIVQRYDANAGYWINFDYTKYKVSAERTVANLEAQGIIARIV